MGRNDVVHAQENLTALKRQRHPGPGLIMGINMPETHIIQVYWIMGDQQNRNSIFSSHKGKLSVVPIDAKNVCNPLLESYDAMHEVSDGPPESDLLYVVGNGPHTNTIVNGAYLRKSFFSVIEHQCYESRAPHFPSRISGMVSFRLYYRKVALSFGIARKATGETHACEHEFHKVEHVPPGTGLCITTYDGTSGNDEPLLPFSQRPYLLPFAKKAEEVIESLWDPTAVYFEDLLAIAVKEIDRHDGSSCITIKNKYAPKPSS